MLIHALVLFLTNQHAEAVAQLTALLKMDPDNQRAQTLRSRVKIIQKLEASADSLHQSSRWSDAVAKWGEVLQVSQFSKTCHLLVLTDV
jgi:predicted Zn-dependent protease